jgi:hypothetical protein
MANKVKVGLQTVCNDIDWIYLAGDKGTVVQNNESSGPIKGAGFVQLNDSLLPGRNYGLSTYITLIAKEHSKIMYVRYPSIAIRILDTVQPSVYYLNATFR